MKCHNCQARRLKVERDEESLKKTLDGLSAAEFVRTVALRCGLSRCPLKMLL
jgi:hypothetical protein